MVRVMQVCSMLSKTLVTFVYVFGPQLGYSSWDIVASWEPLTWMQGRTPERSVMNDRRSTSVEPLLFFWVSLLSWTTIAKN